MDSFGGLFVPNTQVLGEDGEQAWPLRKLFCREWVSSAQWRRPGTKSLGRTEWGRSRGLNERGLLVREPATGPGVKLGGR